MELINTSCATVALEIFEVPGAHRACRVTAKLTLDIGPRGQLTLVTEDPLPVLSADEPTSLGIRPRDVGALGVPDDEVEVFVNAVAHAPGGAPTEAMRVSLRLGAAHHYMHVLGDREWIGWGEEAQIGPAQPFVRMPLTWERAFGGTCELWIDENSPIDAPHSQNPHGRGVDPERMALRFAERFGAPESYPRFERQRALPNLEDPAHRISGWSDTPLPLCWAACPPDAAGAAELPDANATDSVRALDLSAPDEATRALSSAILERSHPALRLPAEPYGTAIVLRGVVPEGDGELAFRLPPVVVELDYEIDGRRGERRCRMRRVLIEAEERRVFLTYEDKFQYTCAEGAERTLRVRVQEGAE